MDSASAPGRTGPTRAVPRGLLIAALVLLVARILLLVFGGWERAVTPDHREVRGGSASRADAG